MADIIAHAKQNAAAVAGSVATSSAKNDGGGCSAVGGCSPGASQLPAPPVACPPDRSLKKGELDAKHHRSDGCPCEGVQEVPWDGPCTGFGSSTTANGGATLAKDSTYTGSVNAAGCPIKGPQQPPTVNCPPQRSEKKSKPTLHRKKKDSPGVLQPTGPNATLDTSIKYTPNGIGQPNSTSVIPHEEWATKADNGGVIALPVTDADGANEAFFGIAKGVNEESPQVVPAADPISPL